MVYETLYKQVIYRMYNSYLKTQYRVMHTICQGALGNNYRKESGYMTSLSTYMHMQIVHPWVPKAVFRHAPGGHWILPGSNHANFCLAWCISDVCPVYIPCLNAALEIAHWHTIAYSFLIFRKFCGSINVISFHYFTCCWHIRCWNIMI